MAAALRREGMTMEVAARQLGVSVKTVSRWVGGTTEPRLRDLRRIRELFGDFPLPCPLPWSDTTDISVPLETASGPFSG